MTSPRRVEVRRATVNDADVITEIQGESWVATYPHARLQITAAALRRRLDGDHGERREERREQWRTAIASRERTVLVGCTNGQPVGFCAPGRYGTTHRLGALYVLPAFQHHGVGTALIEEALRLLDSAAEIRICVVSYNRSAIRFYEHFGFRQTGVELCDEFAQNSGDIALPQIEMVHTAVTPTL